MRSAASVWADSCLLRRSSHAQQAQLAIQSLPAAASAFCNSPSQPQKEPNMQSAVQPCDLSVPQALCLQTQTKPELQSVQDIAQHEALDDKADEHAQSDGSFVHAACNCSAEHDLQRLPRPCQQAAESCPSHKEAQPAAHDGVVPCILSLCDSASAFLDGKGSRISSHGSVWVPQSSLSPEFHCTAPQVKGKRSSQKCILSGIPPHKSVRRSIRHQAKVMA